jgi:hypothetical protein
MHALNGTTSLLIITEGQISEGWTMLHREHKNK